MNFNYLTGKKFAIWAVSENDKGENESAVFSGITRWTNGHLFLDRQENKSFQFPDYILKDIKPVPSSVADILMRAEYYTTLYIASLPKDANPEDYIYTVLKLPE
jgi:hypothetical protein